MTIGKRAGIDEVDCRVHDRPDLRDAFPGEVRVAVDRERPEHALETLGHLVDAGVDPLAVRWPAQEGVQESLFDGDAGRLTPPATARTNGGLQSRRRRWRQLPAGFIELARLVAMHADPDRFTLLHQMAAQLAEAPQRWQDTLDPRRLQLQRMASEVRRDIHKMHAFVRFRRLTDAQGERHVAWFEPRHAVVRAAAPFFVRRFAAMHWSILTPHLSLDWDLQTLQSGPGAPRSMAPAADDGEALWIAYYRSIFNPARLNPAAMRREMPRHYWANLPEAESISTLIREAPARSARMQAEASEAARRLPQSRSGKPLPMEAAPRAVPASASPPSDSTARLRDLAARARHCSDCPLARPATQTVWGEGSVDATLMLVGEQPGDQEDLAGRPFVGPAGQLLHQAIDSLAWPRQALYLTNAVKHFRFEPRGKRRIHKTPGQREMMACQQWLEAEIALVQPQAIIALGSTAASALLGTAVRVADAAGSWQLRTDGIPVWVVHHPAAILRRAESGAPPFDAWVEALRPAGVALTTAPG